MISLIGLGSSPEVGPISGEERLGGGGGDGLSRREAADVRADMAARAEALRANCVEASS